MSALQLWLVALFSLVLLFGCIGWYARQVRIIKGQYNGYVEEGALGPEVRTVLLFFPYVGFCYAGTGVILPVFVVVTRWIA